MSAVGAPQMGTNMASPLDRKKVFFFFLKIGFARRKLRDIAGILVCYTAVFSVITQCGEERCVTTLKTAVWQTTGIRTVLYSTSPYKAQN